MKVSFYLCGKTTQPYLIEGLRLYTERIKHFIPFEIVTLPGVRKKGKMNENELKKKEGEIVLKRLSTSDFLILLDEKGKEYDSKKFSGYIDKLILSGQKQVTFLIGGPYGFSPEIYQHSNHMISLSKMTFSHQMVRLVFIEQLYRAFTIIKGMPYHNS